jgi:hypothetical protein
MTALLLLPTPTATTIPSLRDVTPLRFTPLGVATMLELVPSQCSITPWISVGGARLAPHRPDIGRGEYCERIELAGSRIIGIAGWRRGGHDAPGLAVPVLNQAQGVALADCPARPLKCSASVTTLLVVLPIQPTAQMSLSLIAAAPLRFELLINGLDTTCRPCCPKARPGPLAIIPIASNPNNKRVRGAFTLQQLTSALMFLFR